MNTHTETTLYVNMNIMYECMWHTHTYTEWALCVYVSRVDGLQRFLEGSRVCCLSKKREKKML